MAQLIHPRKSKDFVVEINGIISARVQKVQHPEIEVETDEHAETNYKIKTAGLVATSNGMLELISPVEGASRADWEWLTEVQNTTTGSGLSSSVYKRPLVIRELAPDGRTALSSWVWHGCFPVKRTMTDSDRMSSDNAKVTIEISVDRVEQL